MSSELYEVEGTYGSDRTASIILCYGRHGYTWYCVMGSVNVNCTVGDLEDDVDVEELEDFDTFTWDKPINTLDELEEAVED